jgi:hypothetical protein
MLISGYSSKRETITTLVKTADILPDKMAPTIRDKMAAISKIPIQEKTTAFSPGRQFLILPINKIRCG